MGVGAEEDDTDVWKWKNHDGVFASFPIGMYARVYLGFLLVLAGKRRQVHFTTPIYIDIRINMCFKGRIYKPVSPKSCAFRIGRGALAMLSLGKMPTYRIAGASR